jgi:hypothetical protein
MKSDELIIDFNLKLTSPGPLTRSRLGDVQPAPGPQYVSNLGWHSWSGLRMAAVFIGLRRIIPHT